MRPDERGVTIVLFAMLMVVLLVFVALVVDLGNVRQVARHEQSAADLGALAGAQDLPVAADAIAAAAKYAASTMSDTAASPVACPAGVTAASCFSARAASIRVTTPYKGSTQKIKVEVCQTVNFFFAQVIAHSAQTPCRSAAAGIRNGTFEGASILVLAPTGSKTFVCSGSCDVNVGSTGSVVVNSTNTGAIDASGGTSIAAGTVHGFVHTSGAAVVTCAQSATCPTDHNPSPDPLASLAAPSTTGLLHYSGEYTPVFQPGVYDGTLNVSSATACLNPGTYYLTKGLTISGGSVVTMCAGTTGGVFFYNADGKFTISGGSTVNVTAPTSGPYAGVIVFQARTNSETLTLSGGSGLTLPGTFYNPAGRTTISGGSGTADSSGIGRIITDTLTVSGASKIGPGFAGGGGGTGSPTISLIE